MLPSEGCSCRNDPVPCHLLPEVDIRTCTTCTIYTYILIYAYDEYHISYCTLHICYDTAGCLLPAPEVNICHSHMHNMHNDARVDHAPLAYKHKVWALLTYISKLLTDAFLHKVCIIRTVLCVYHRHTLCTSWRMSVLELLSHIIPSCHHDRRKYETISWQNKTAELLILFCQFWLRGPCVSRDQHVIIAWRCQSRFLHNLRHKSSHPPRLYPWFSSRNGT